MSGHLSDPFVDVDAETIRTLVEVGGYVHPLFRGDTSDPPLPGQALLLLMGGLAEQSGRLDQAIAMVEIQQVRFAKMATSGTRVRVAVTPGSWRTTSSGKVLQEWTWTATEDSGAALADARVLMLMRAPEEQS